MNIQKVIKTYFVFVMAIIATAALSYNDDVRGYMANTLDINVESNFTPVKHNSTLMEKLGAKSNNEFFFKPNGDNAESIIFQIENDSQNAFAEPGAADVDMMSFKIKTFNETLTLNSMRLLVDGIDAKNIKRAVLVQPSENGGEVIAKANLKGDHIVFDRINFVMGPSSGTHLYLRLDLGENLKINDRLSLSIEKTEDIGITAGGKTYELSAYYPMKGKYLTIATTRP